MSRDGWGAALSGHEFDLEDWQGALKHPYDPWVVETRHGRVLRSAVFDAASAASEVHDRASVLIALLNGALAASNRTKTVELESVIEFMSDGTDQRHAFAKVLAEGRLKDRFDAVVLGPGGNLKPPQPPKPSEAQLWLQVAANDDALADALIYYSRDDWFDIYKALECLFRRFGGERKFLSQDWAVPIASQIVDLKRTANNERHARLKNKSNPSPIARGGARDLLGTLIKLAFIEVQESPSKAARTP